MDTKIPTSPLDYDVSMETIEKITRNSTYDAIFPLRNSPMDLTKEYAFSWE